VEHRAKPCDDEAETQASPLSLSHAADADGFVLHVRDTAIAYQARRLFASYLERFAHSDSDAHAAELIFGELFTNAVRYAPGPHEARVFWRDDVAVLEVIDRGTGYLIDPQLPHDFSESQRGLYIVAQLAGRLDVEQRADRTVTTAVLPVYRRGCLTSRRAS
jgi:anti-sigma regulatory factor (Ser/Thr protein kinase)